MGVGVESDEIDITQFNVPCDKNWREGGKEPTFGIIEDPESGLRSGVYWIYCLASDIVYIGNAVNFKKRWNVHLRNLGLGRHHSPRLQNSWDKYGPSAFAFEVLEFVEPGIDQLLWREQIYLDAFQAYDPEYGFNGCSVAGSALGRKMTEETKRKLSEAHSGKTVSNETRRKLSEINRGKILSDEHKRKMGESRRGKTKSEEHRRKIGEAHLGMTHSDEAKQKMSEAHRDKKCSNETKQKMSEARRGRTMSDEVRDKIRKTLLGHEVSEETRRKIGEANAGKKKKSDREDGIVG